MVEQHRIEERLDQAETRIHRVAIRVETRHVVRQHRVAEAVNRVRELGEDRRVDVRRAVEHEGVDVRIDAARELLEHEVLVLHLGRVAAGLEQALAVPVQRLGEGRQLQRRHAGRRIELGLRDVGDQPLVEEGEIASLQQRQLLLVDLAVVFRVEDVVNGRETDVLVAAAIAGDEVTIEQLVVVFELLARLRIHGDGVADGGVRVRRQHAANDNRRSVVRDVVKEGVTGAHSARRPRVDRVRSRTGDDNVICRVGNAVGAKTDDKLRHAGDRIRDELAIEVGAQQRDAADVAVVQRDAEHQRLRLHFGPRRQAIAGHAIEQFARGDRLAARVELVLAQEHLVRRV